MVNNKIFQEFTTISAELWKSSVAYAKQDKPMISISCANCEDLEECSNTVHYFMPAGDEDTLTHDQVESYRATFRDGSWTSFSEFLSQAFGIWQVEMSTSADEWKNATCSCPVFYKDYICKHIIGVALPVQHCKPPSAARVGKLVQKAKRGAKPKATKALLRR